MPARPSRPHLLHSVLKLNYGLIARSEVKRKPFQRPIASGLVVITCLVMTDRFIAFTDLSLLLSLVSGPRALPRSLSESKGCVRHHL